MKKYGFGVDVGGTTVKMGFFETSGELLDKWEIKTDTSDNGKAVLPDIAQAIDNKLAQEGISKSDVEGVGIGVPGPVRSDGVVNGCVNLGWGVIDQLMPGAYSVRITLPEGYVYTAGGAGSMAERTDEATVTLDRSAVSARFDSERPGGFLRESTFAGVWRAGWFSGETD